MFVGKAIHFLAVVFNQNLGDFQKFGQINPVKRGFGKRGIENSAYAQKLLHNIGDKSADLLSAYGKRGDTAVVNLLFLGSNPVPINVFVIVRVVFCNGRKVENKLFCKVLNRILATFFLNFAGKGRLFNGAFTNYAFKVDYA